MTSFRRILQRAVEATPHAIGGAFADSEGEMVDSYSTLDPHEWAVLTAHYGVVLGHLVAALGTWHYGGPEYFIAQHKKLEIIVFAVEAGYFVLLAFDQPCDITVALEQMRVAADELRQEMA